MSEYFIYMVITEFTLGDFLLTTMNDFLNHFPDKNLVSGSYLFHGPLDQSVDPLVSFTIETNEISLVFRYHSEDQWCSIAYFRK